MKFHSNNDQLYIEPVASFDVVLAAAAAPHPTLFLFFLVEYSNIRILFH